MYLPATIVSRLFVTALIAAVSIPAAWAQTIQIEDTYSREDSTDLGVTEVGAYPYLEIGTTTPPGDVADIFDEEIVVYGNAGIDGTGPGLALIDGVELSDATISADVRFEGLGLNGLGTASNNVAGFMFRRNGETSGFGASNAGQVEVTMFPGGGFFIRELLVTGLNVLYQDNPFGLGGSMNTNYSSAGQIPTTFNGAPLDANGNGVLEDSETFQLSASLTGNMLDVAVNGLNVVSLNTTLSGPQYQRSTIGLYKNRFTGAAGLDPANMAFDNLVITGTEYIPPPPPPILHVGDNNPLDEGWLPQNAGTIANNGPVDDNGTPAWNIQDTGGGTRAAWIRDLTDDQAADALAEGWTYRATLKVLNLEDVPDGSIELSVFPDSPVGYTLWLGSDANGDTLVSEFGGVLSGGLALGRTAVVTGMDYIDYEMVYNPDTDTVDVFANDSLVLDDMLPLDREASSLNRILWGSNAGGATGNANYSHIEFIIGAEPAGPLGDYNDDGIVDAADYTRWRDALGSSTTLANDDIGGEIGQAHYEQWRDNFGANGSLALSPASVPEPSGFVLLVLGLCGCTYGLRRKW